MRDFGPTVFGRKQKAFTERVCSFCGEFAPAREGFSEVNYHRQRVLECPGREARARDFPSDIARVEQVVCTMLQRMGL
jgi:hypothetical protein